MERERHRLISGTVSLPAMLLVLGIGMHYAANAQTTIVGSISGTVRDPTGAVVPKAHVVIEEQRTGFSRKGSRAS